MRRRDRYLWESYVAEEQGWHDAKNHRVLRRWEFDREVVLRRKLAKATGA